MIQTKDSNLTFRPLTIDDAEQYNAFWLDNSEPDYGVYDFDHYRYIDGPALSCSNIYPQLYSRVFYDGMKAEGEENIVNLLRCAWAGSQKYGNVVWSGDVPSTFEAFYDQLQAQRSRFTIFSSPSAFMPS